MSYPSQINVLEGEVVELPFTGNELDDNTLAIIRYSQDGGVIENVRSKAELINQNGFVHGTVRIAGLEHGRYSIKLHEIGTEIALVVHNGVYWQTDSFIVKKHSMVELRENQNYVRVSDVQFMAPKDNQQTISMTVSAARANP